MSAVRRPAYRTGCFRARLPRRDLVLISVAPIHFIQGAWGHWHNHDHRERRPKCSRSLVRTKNHLTGHRSVRSQVDYSPQGVTMVFRLSRVIFASLFLSILCCFGATLLAQPSGKAPAAPSRFRAIIVSKGNPNDLKSPIPSAFRSRPFWSCDPAGSGAGLRENPAAGRRCRTSGWGVRVFLGY